MENKRLFITSEGIEKKSAINKITSESNNIKARLKSKYLLYKLQRDFFRRKFY